MIVCSRFTAEDRRRRIESATAPFVRGVVDDLNNDARVNSGRIHPKSVSEIVDRHATDVYLDILTFDKRHQAYEALHRSNPDYVPTDPYSQANEEAVHAWLREQEDALPRRIRLECPDYLHCGQDWEESVRSALAECSATVWRIYSDRRVLFPFVQRIPEASVDPVEENLRGQPFKLYRYLRGKMHATSYDTLAGLENVWQGPLPANDETVYRGLRRLREVLNDLGVSLVIEHSNRRTKLDRSG